MAAADPDDMLGALLGTFAVEAAEHLQAMNRHLLSLEGGAGGTDRAELGAELFREAHSLKGAARAVNLAEVEERAHQLEELFTVLRNEPGGPDPAVLDRTYRLLDAIDTLLAGSTAAAPADPSPAAPPTTADQPAASRPTRPRVPTVRVATAKLDALLAGVGELLVTRIGVEQRLADIGDLDALLADWDSAWLRPRRRGPDRASERADGVPAEDSRARLGDARRSLGLLRRGLESDVRRMVQVVADLQDDVRRTRMVPAAAVFEVFPRMIRDLAHGTGKELTLRVEGGETEVDRSVLEQIKDPLTHLLRNCVDHGIEPPELRAAAGKPRSGTIGLSARQRGDMLVLEVTDDGAGIDPARVRTAAVRAGLLTGHAAEDLADHDTIPLIFRSGLSTSPAVTDLSGRGVGLDVVREAVERLHGSIDVHSGVGRGSTFVLALPLSVSTMHCLLLQAAGQTFALPAAAVQRVVRVAAGDVRRAQGRQVVRVDDRPVALARLADVLDLGDTADGTDPVGKRPAIVLAAHGAGLQDGRVALLVDRLAGTLELVVKSLPAPLLRVRHVAGAAILGSGEVAVILNAADLATSVERADAAPPGLPTAAEAEPATVLVVEDSLTTRTLEKNLLEAAGYRVQVAADGRTAWNLLGSIGCDLVVADIEMPQMDGFELTTRIRADPRFQDLPVVLVTSRDSREDHQRGVQVGADAYIVKGALDQNRLIDTIRRLT